MFTLEQIEQIHIKLQLFGVKDEDLPILTEQLNGNEIITVVKDGRNIQLLIRFQNQYGNLLVSTEILQDTLAEKLPPYCMIRFM